MKRFFLLMALIPSLAFGAAENGFVGHGGHGIARGNKLFVRDLVTHGVEEHPYFGGKTDPYYLEKLPASAALGFSYPRELLARKLTDLDALGLGQVLLLSLRSYQWLLVDEPLTPVTDADDPVELQPGEKLFQIGNRLGTTIRLQSEGWKQLDDANKAALMIHEMVFSLVRLSPINRNQRCLDQLPRTAREITGSFFTASFFQGNPAIQYQDLAGQIAIPDTMINVKDARLPPAWTLVLGKKKREFGFFSKADPQKFLNDFCDEVRAAARFRNKPEVRSAFTPALLQVDLQSYNTCRVANPTGTPTSMGRQQYLLITAMPRNQNEDYFHYDDLSQTSCEGGFANHLSRAQSILY